MVEINDFNFKFAIVVVPLILFTIFLLPHEIKDSFLILKTDNPTLLSLFMSNYTHLTPEHLFWNVLAYLLTIFLILKIEINKDLLNRMFIFLFLILPLPLSILTVHIYPHQTACGFSGIAAGFLGYLPAAALRRIINIHDIVSHLYLLSLIFAINILMTFVNNQLVANFLHIILLSIFFIVLVNLKVILYILSKLKNMFIIKILKNKRLDLLVLSLILTLFCFLALAILIPYPNNIGETKVNLFVHYVAYFCGLYGSLVLLFLGRNSQIKCFRLKNVRICEMGVLRR